MREVAATALLLTAFSASALCPTDDGAAALQSSRFAAARAAVESCAAMRERRF